MNEKNRWVPKRPEFSRPTVADQAGEEQHLRLFAERGFRSTTIGDLASVRTGTATDSSTTTSRSKDDLLQAVLDQYIPAPAPRPFSRSPLIGRPRRSCPRLRSACRRCSGNVQRSSAFSSSRRRRRIRWSRKTLAQVRSKGTRAHRLPTPVSPASCGSTTRGAAEPCSGRSSRSISARPTPTASTDLVAVLLEGIRAR